MMQEGGRAKQEEPTQEGSRGQCGVAASTGVGSRTTLGLKGGSTARFSSRTQLMVLKKGWILMFPVTPSLLFMSRSSSCNPAKEPG